MSFWNRILNFFRDENQPIDFLQLKIRYHFSNQSLAKDAITHKSVRKQNRQNTYERLEYLGDAVVQLLVSEYLYKKFPRATEGELTKFRSRLVNRKHLATIATKNGFKQFLISRNSNNEPALLSELFESIAGAIFLDGGLSEAKKYIDRFLLKDKESLRAIAEDRNYKGQIVEYCQKVGFPLPEFRVTSVEGPSHEQRFLVSVVINRKTVGTGEGNSKKSASQRAAKKSLAQIEEQLPNSLIT